MAPSARTVGIVGLGFGRAHIPAFQSHGCEVLAVCQRDQGVARKVAERYGIPRVFERWEQMLEQAQAGIAHPSRTVPGGGREGDAEDYCAVTGELISGALVTLVASRVARGVSQQTLEAYGTDGALQYRLDRDRPRWWRGELRAVGKSGSFAPVKAPAGLPRSGGEGDTLDVVGKTTIAPLVKRFLAATRTGQSPSPSFEGGMRAQAVLDAVLESIASGGRMVSI